MIELISYFFNNFYTFLTDPTYSTLITFVVSIVFGFLLWLFNFMRDRDHQKYLKKIIENNTRDLIQIINKISADVELINDNDENAKRLAQYFSRKIGRLELLRVNVENQLTQLKDKDEKYKKNIRKILESENIILETYDRIDIPDESRFHLWKKDPKILQENVEKILNIASELKINVNVSKS